MKLSLDFNWSELCARPPSLAVSILVITILYCSAYNSEALAQATEVVKVLPSSEKTWYQTGFWSLMGPAVALIFTNAIAIFLVYLQSERSFKLLLKQRKIERLSASLSDFYDPLLALIDINGAIFQQTGPKSFPKEALRRKAAALVWKETKKKVLLNNDQIEEILRTKSHLMGESDSLESYHNLLLHVAMYDSFQKIETELYRDFLFPTNIRDHLFKQRIVVLEEFNRLSGDTI
jgi:hypothetical protein